MNYLIYIISIALLRMLALLPRKLLYIISDFLSFLLYNIAGYRKTIVTNNLKKSFPDYTEKQIKVIRKKFYRHLSDLILENAVMQFYSRKRLEKMFRFSNPEIVKEYYKLKRDVILITGHYNNWEWAYPLSFAFDYQIVGSYKPIKNRYFDRALKKSRTKHGAIAIPMASVARTLYEYKQKGVPTLTGMVSDQRPIRKYIRYWTNFLNQKTAVLTGSEKLARKFDAVVMFLKIRKVKRGIYVGEFELITDKPNETTPNEITEKHTRILEKLIMEEPAWWLWSHNRWKLSYEKWLALNKQTNQHDSPSTNPSV